MDRPNLTISKGYCLTPSSMVTLTFRRTSTDTVSAKEMSMVTLSKKNCTCIEGKLVHMAASGRWQRTGIEIFIITNLQVSVEERRNLRIYE